MPRRAVRVGLLAALHRREEIARTVLRYYAGLEVRGLRLHLQAVGSEPCDRAVAAACAWQYVEAPNHPLSDKHNVGARSLKDLDLDALVVVGSDDLLTRGYFEALPRLVRAGKDIAYLDEIHMMHLPTRRAVRCAWPYVGAGRMLSRHVLDAVAWKPWPGGHDRLLDQAMMRRVQPHIRPGAWHGFSPRRDAGVKAIALKDDSLDSLWSYDERRRRNRCRPSDGLRLLAKYWPGPAEDLGLTDNELQVAPMPLPKTINEKQAEDWTLGIVTGNGFTNKHYGVRGCSRGDYFWGPLRWIQDLERVGNAAHTPVPGPEYEAREVKTAGPSKTKPAAAKMTKRHKGGGWYEVMQGGEVVATVKGKDAAHEYVEEYG